MWLRNKEFFKSYAQQNRYYRFTDFIALGNKEKFLKTHLNSQSYCLRKVPGQTCEAAFRGTCFQASRSDSIHSCDLLRFSLAAVLAAPFRLSPVRHFQLRVNCRLKKELPCERGRLDLTSWVDGSSTEREKSWSYQYHEFKISGVKWSKGKWKLPRVSGRFDLPGVDCCFFFFLSHKVGILVVTSFSVQYVVLAIGTNENFRGGPRGRVRGVRTPYETWRLFETEILRSSYIDRIAYTYHFLTVVWIKLITRLPPLTRAPHVSWGGHIKFCKQNTAMLIVLREN